MAVEAKKHVNAPDLMAMKRAGQKIVMLTAYDALFGRLVDEAGVDVILVGDSVTTVLCGEQTTIPATLDQMIYHGRIARRGISRALLVVDLPFLTYSVSTEDALRNAGRLFQETRADAVKLEGGRTVAPVVSALVAAGIPVMGHLGFTPQSVHALGGHKIQGKQEAHADALVEDAKALERAGAFAMVLELMPGPLAKRITEAVAIPTIGIGAGPDCDGQVLVTPDMLGMNEHFNPKFLKRYAAVGETIRTAAAAFAAEVRSGAYPTQAHTHGG
jgi:3-methyl-2-oxobutanoate hydroxymethyltransferase